LEKFKRDYMVIIGHPYIESEKIYKISSKEEIYKTAPNSSIFLQFSEDNLEIFKFAVENSISVIAEVVSLKEAILSEALGVKYIVSEFSIAKELQKVAENYMYNSKILCWIKDETQLENVAKSEIDGVIFKNYPLEIGK
jgi:hypothetical protein